MSKSNKTNLLKFSNVASKVMEVISWIGAACILLILIASIIDLNWATVNLMADSGVTMNGVSIAVGEGADATSNAALLVILAFGVIAFIIQALIFRNLSAVLKTGETGSPFQPANVKRIERIGYLSIVMPVLGFLFTTIARLVGGPDALEISFDLSGVIMGMLVLCLSQFFAHGVKLEQDVDGLV